LSSLQNFAMPAVAASFETRRDITGAPDGLKYIGQEPRFSQG